MWLYLIIFFVPVLAYFLFDRKLCHSVKFLAIIMALLALFVGLAICSAVMTDIYMEQLFDMLADDMRQGRSPVEAYVFEQYKGEWVITG
jgi:D-alanyl-lipoteichoic acid acyltransferase DltB (MBOAT superfamily)